VWWSAGLQWAAARTPFTAAGTCVCTHVSSSGWHPLTHPCHLPLLSPPPTHPPQKASKAQKRREKRAQEDAEREARIAEELASLGTSERLAEEAALKELLLPLGLGIKDIRVSGV
jgi:hypothetical protein